MGSQVVPCLRAASGEEAASLKQVRRLLVGGEYERALQFVEPITSREHAEPLARCYYGAALVLSFADPVRGKLLCEQAAQEGFYLADTHYFLGRVRLAMGDKTGAVRSYRKGLLADAAHAELKREIEILGMRRPLAFKGLARSHLLNRWTGKLTWWLGFRGTAEPLS